MYLELCYLLEFSTWHLISHPQQFYYMKASYPAFLLPLDNACSEGICNLTAENPLPRWPVDAYIISVIICLTASAVFHSFYCISKRVSDILQILDYCGICIVIAGASIPLIYYSFYFYPRYLKLHMIMIISIITLSSIVLTSPTFRYIYSYLLISISWNRQPNYRKVRSLCFVSLGCYSLLVLMHIYTLDKFDNQFNAYMVWYWCGMAFFNILGAFLYASRIPERFYPGHFDFLVRFARFILFTIWPLGIFSSIISCMCSYCRTIPLYRIISTVCWTRKRTSIGIRIKLSDNISFTPSRGFIEEEWYLKFVVNLLCFV